MLTPEAAIKTWAAAVDQATVEDVAYSMAYRAPALSEFGAVHESKTAATEEMETPLAPRFAMPGGRVSALPSAAKLLGVLFEFLAWTAKK